MPKPFSSSLHAVVRFFGIWSIILLGDGTDSHRWTLLRIELNSLSKCFLTPFQKNPELRQSTRSHGGENKTVSMAVT